MSEPTPTAPPVADLSGLAIVEHLTRQTIDITRQNTDGGCTINPQIPLTRRTKQIGPKTSTLRAQGMVPMRAGRGPGPNASTVSAQKIKNQIMLVAGGDLPMAKACPFVRRFFEVHGRVSRQAIKGKTLREYREMCAEVFKLLPRDDTLTVRPEVIYIGQGADEAADEAEE